MRSFRSSAERAGWSPQEVDRALSDPGQPLPRIVFLPEVCSCPVCEKRLKVYGTHTRTVTTLAEGSFEAKEKLLRCDVGETERRGSCPTVRPEDLQRLVPPGQSFGYDLIVHVGLARYLNGMQREEIRAALRARGLLPSEGSITNLCDRFLSHLERLHLLRSPYLRAAMSRGYPLHIDATCEKGKGGLFLCMDGLRGWVLLSERIESESEKALKRPWSSSRPKRPLRNSKGAMFFDAEPLREDLLSWMRGRSSQSIRTPPQPAPGSARAAPGRRHRGAAPPRRRGRRESA